MPQANELYNQKVLANLLNMKGNIVDQIFQPTPESLQEDLQKLLKDDLDQGDKKEDPFLEERYKAASKKYYEVLDKTKSRRAADRAVAKMEKMPSFKDQLKAYYRETNKEKLGES